MWTKCFVIPVLSFVTGLGRFRQRDRKWLASFSSSASSFSASLSSSSSSSLLHNYSVWRSGGFVWDFCVCNSWEVVTFCLRVWCMLCVSCRWRSSVESMTVRISIVRKTERMRGQTGSRSTLSHERAGHTSAGRIKLLG